MCTCTYAALAALLVVYGMYHRPNEPRVPPREGSPLRGCRPCCFSQLNFLTVLMKVIESCFSCSFKWGVGNLKLG